MWLPEMTPLMVAVAWGGGAHLTHPPITRSLRGPQDRTANATTSQRSGSVPLLPDRIGQYLLEFLKTPEAANQHDKLLGVCLYSGDQGHCHYSSRAPRLSAERNLSKAKTQQSTARAQVPASHTPSGIIRRGIEHSDPVYKMNILRTCIYLLTQVQQLHCWDPPIHHSVHPAT